MRKALWLFALLCCGLTSGRLPAQNCPTNTYEITAWGVTMDTALGQQHHVICQDAQGQIYLQGVASILPLFVDGTCYAANAPGVDAGAKIAACIVLLPATGGTVDARGLEGAQTAAATIVIPANIRLQLGALTLVSAQNPVVQLTGNGAMLDGIGHASMIQNNGVADTILIRGTSGLSNVEVKNLNLHGNNTAARGIVALVVTQATIEGNYISNHKDNGIEVNGVGAEGSTHVMIARNRIIQNTGAPIAFAAGIRIGGTSVNTTVHLRDNYTSGTGPGWPYGLDNRGVQTVSIGNIYETSSVAGVIVRGGGVNFLSLNDWLEVYPAGLAYHFEGNDMMTVIRPHGITGLADMTFDLGTNSARLLLFLNDTFQTGPLTVSGELTVTPGGVNRFFTSTAGGVARLNLGGALGFIFNRVDTASDIFFGEPTDTGSLVVRGGPLGVKRLKANQGTALAAGDFALSAGWGATATVAVGASDRDQNFQVTITAQGGGYGANPTVAFTFKDLTFTTLPNVVCNRNDALATAGRFAQTTLSATVPIFTFVGTPAAGEVYKMGCSFISN
jgi:hypothetical protein